MRRLKLPNDGLSLRFDRAGTLYLARPFLRLLPSRGVRIPILMYHSVADEDESAGPPYYRIATAPALFLQQMTWLHEWGYRTTNLATAMELLQADGNAAEKVVVITFDDGYRNFCQYASPALERFGFTATVFLPTGSIGDQPQVFNRRECMTWKDVRELQQCGISFGSHTVTHPQLHGLKADRIREEIVRSRQTIEEKTGCAIDSFAYPYAFPQTDTRFKAVLREILTEHGYRYGVCTQIGRAERGSDPLFLERLPVNSADDAALLGAKVAGAYDWVGDVQSMVKRIRRPRRQA